LPAEFRSPAHPRFLEGEGPGNDATALILYRFAVAAVSVNLFSFGKARDCSPPIVAGEIVWGSALAR
jgi:monovalent cation/hydrogen antiporter